MTSSNKETKAALKISLLKRKMRMKKQRELKQERKRRVKGLKEVKVQRRSCP